MFIYFSKLVVVSRFTKAYGDPEIDALRNRETNGAGETIFSSRVRLASKPLVSQEGVRTQVCRVVSTPGFAAVRSKERFRFTGTALRGNLKSYSSAGQGALRCI